MRADLEGRQRAQHVGHGVHQWLGMMRADRQGRQRCGRQAGLPLQPGRSMRADRSGRQRLLICRESPQGHPHAQAPYRTAPSHNGARVARPGAGGAPPAGTPRLWGKPNLCNVPVVSSLESVGRGI